MLYCWRRGEESNATQLDENRGSTEGKKANIRDRQGGEHIPHASDVAVQSLKSYGEERVQLTVVGLS